MVQAGSVIGTLSALRDDMTRISVFLLDDHPIVRQGLRALIEAQADMIVVGEAASARGIGDVPELLAADVIVMDVSMPGPSGAQAVEEILNSSRYARILALSRHRERCYVDLMMSGGARGYVFKQTPAEQLLAAIRVVADGGTFLDPALAEATPTLTSSGLPLTRREQQIAAMIAYGHTNKEISASLGVAVKTVETHKTNIMQKLQMKSRAELVRFALTQGWLQTA